MDTDAESYYKTTKKQLTAEYPKDVWNYLEEINYEFTAAEAAYIIYWSE